MWYYYVVTMNLDNVPKYMDFMKNYLENTVIVVHGGYLWMYLIAYLSQRLLKERYYVYTVAYHQI